MVGTIIILVLKLKKLKSQDTQPGSLAFKLAPITTSYVPKTTHRGEERMA